MRGRLAIAALALLGTREAFANETFGNRISTSPRGYDRPFTVAQLGVGFLTIPGADVCLKDRPCTKGDTSIELDFWQMYRANADFAVGAGASVALKPTVDSPPSEPGFDRSHTRGYFLVEAQARYYALHLEWIEAWIGATVGGVIVSDRYTIEGGDEPKAAIIGPRSSTIRTEGGTVGGLIGGQWTFAPNWAIGLSVRYMRWFLPHEPARTVFLDTATLTDQQSVLNIGLLCSYKIAL
jgi:hypothetical protein